MNFSFIFLLLVTLPFNVLAEKNNMPQSINRKVIRQVFIKHQRLVQNCYTPEVQKEVTSGQVMLDFDINKLGQVIRSSISKEKSTISNDKLNTCLIDMVKKLTFPEATTDKVLQVFYPLVFSKN